MPDGAADEGGIQAGDIVTKVDGKDVTPEQTLSFLVANISPGTRVPIELYRDGSRRTVRVTVGKRPTEDELRQQQQFNADGDTEDDVTSDGTDSEMVAEALGLQVLDLTPQIARQLGISVDTKGMVIGAVDPNSDAARKGLQRGDVILSANYKGVASTADLETAVKQAKEARRDAVLLRIQRRGRPAEYVAVRMR